jgi:hypothetical protein
MERKYPREMRNTVAVNMRILLRFFMRRFPIGYWWCSRGGIVNVMGLERNWEWDDRKN